MEELALLARLVLGWLLLGGGVAKFARLGQFRAAVADYQLLPPSAVQPAAVGVAAAEAALGGCLVSGVAVRPAAVLAATLFTLLTVAIGINLSRGRRIDCGCIGVSPRTKISGGLVARNALLIAVSMGVAIVADPMAGVRSAVPLSITVLGAFLLIRLGSAAIGATGAAHRVATAGGAG